MNIGPMSSKELRRCGIRGNLEILISKIVKMAQQIHKVINALSVILQRLRSVNELQY